MYESELNMVSGAFLAALCYINIISAPRLHADFCSARLLLYTGELLLISQRPPCCFFGSLVSQFEGLSRASHGMDRTLRVGCHSSITDLLNI